MSVNFYQTIRQTLLFMLWYVIKYVHPNNYWYVWKVKLNFLFKKHQLRHTNFTHRTIWNLIWNTKKSTFLLWNSIPHFKLRNAVRSTSHYFETSHIDLTFPAPEHSVWHHCIHSNFLSVEKDVNDHQHGTKTNANIPTGVSSTKILHGNSLQRSHILFQQCSISY